MLRLALIATLVTGIAISVVSCSEFGIGQELKAEIVGFEARRQPLDISKVIFLVSLERTEQTIKGAEYIVSLLIDGKVSDSAKVFVRESGSMEGSVTLTSNGPVMNGMLSDLDGKYEQAKAGYEDFQNEVGWDFLRGQLGAKSYDEIKRLQEKETKLKTELNRWIAIRNGHTFGWGYDLPDFCAKYIKLSVTRNTSTR